MENTLKSEAMDEQVKKITEYGFAKRGEQWVKNVIPIKMYEKVEKEKLKI